MKAEVKVLKENAEKARSLYRMGAITREEAKKDIKPYVDAVNNKSKEIAKKYNQRPRLIDIYGFMR